MTITPPYRVRVVVDPAFGERLTDLPPHEPIWIIDSASNTPVAHRLWKERPAGDHLTGITTFKSSSEFTSEDELVAELDTIDLHHGHYSAQPPYSMLEVIGCPPSERIHAALAEFGFRIDSTTSDGFIAIRHDA